MFSPRKVLIEANIPFGSYVADFGCGAGSFVKEVAQLVGENGKVFAIDVQKELVSKISHECQDMGILNVETIWGDIEVRGGSKLQDASVSFVILANILFQASARKEMLGEAARVLKPGGKIIIIDWQPINPKSQGQLGELVINFGPRKQDIVLKEEVDRMMQELGFHKERDIDTGDYHHGGIYKKV